MSKQRFIVCVVAACLAVTVAAGCAVKNASTIQEPLQAPDWQGDPCTRERLDKFIAQYGLRGCKAGAHPEEGLLRGALHDDFWRLRVEYVGKLDSRHLKAFRDGMAMWNRHRYVTGFVFEDAMSSRDVDFRFIAGPPPVDLGATNAEDLQKTSCAGFAPVGSNVWYPTTNWDWVTARSAARIYAHELGHGLNLAHQHQVTVPSVMREGDTGLDCAVLAEHVLADIQPADAVNAFICGCGVRLKWEKDLSARP